MRSELYSLARRNFASFLAREPDVAGRVRETLARRRAALDAVSSAVRLPGTHEPA
jgi:CRP-like cAMP-binding protein